MPGRLLERFHRRRFVWLFVALLATLGARPILETLGSSRDPFDVMLGLCLAMAAVGLVRGPDLRGLVSLAFAAVALVGVGLVLALQSTGAFGVLVWIPVFLLAIVAAVRHALGAGPVDSERIFAALDAYLLAGLLFASAFWALETWRPGSIGGAVSGATPSLRDAVYLSFVTIATLGYGDIVPHSEAARGLAIVEAVGGQMYLAVLVARLVSLYARQHDSD
jgi:hypothetical protein